MKDVPTRIGGPNGEFPSTVDSLVAPAGNSGHGPAAARLEQLVRLYWKPVYCVIRKLGAKTNEDAKDLTQEFFLREVLAGPLLQNYSPERGRFRSFLKGAVFNFVSHAQREARTVKRGGQATVFSLEAGEPDLSQVVPDGDSLSPEALFDRAWKRQVLAEAVELLQKRLCDDGKEVYFQAFRRYDLEGNRGEVSYKEVAESLGITPDTLKNHLVRARKAFVEAVLSVISRYATPSEASLELRELFAP